MAEMILRWLVPIGGVVAGAAVAWTVLKQKVQVHAQQIADLNEKHALLTGERSPNGMPQFVRRTECVERHDELCRDIKSLVTATESNAAAQERMENFARWVLSVDKGLPIGEVNKIVNGDA